jgi:hypothetical protein
LYDVPHDDDDDDDDVRKSLKYMDLKKMMANNMGKDIRTLNMTVCPPNFSVFTNNL